MKTARKLIWIAFALPAAPIVAYCFWLALTARQADIDHALIMAIKRQDTSAAIRLLDQGANANTQDRPWKPVTFRSLIAEMLARFRGAKPVKPKGNYSSAIALWYTTDSNPDSDNMKDATENLRLIRALLSHGANANGTDWDGYSVLHLAMWSDHFQTATLLLENRANPNLRDSEFLRGPLWYASPRVAEVLLSHGADVNMRDSLGETPLFNIPEFTGLGAAKVLVAHGANVNARNTHGITPTMRAAFYRNVETMQLLYEHGANINARTNNGRTALIRVLRDSVPFAYGNPQPEVRWLLQHGARVSVRDKEGNTAVDYAGNLPVSNAAVIRLLNQQGCIELTDR